MKKHIITIAGFPGSGKSSAAEGVAKELGYGHFSSGDLFRKMASERGLSVEEMNMTAEKQKEVDLEVDKVLQEIGKEKNDLVIDSRMAFHWIPDSFKIFLDLDAKTAAERVFAHIQQEGRESQAAVSVEEVYEKTKKRMESEQKRYADLYQVDCTDKSQFDLVIDTGAKGLPEVVGIIKTTYDAWLRVEHNPNLQMPTNTIDSELHS